MSLSSWVTLGSLTSHSVSVASLKYSKKTCRTVLKREYCLVTTSFSLGLLPGGTWAPFQPCMSLSCCGGWALERVGSVAVAHGASLVVAHGLSCPVAFRIFSNQRLNPCTHLAGRSLPTGPPGKSKLHSFTCGLSSYCSTIFKKDYSFPIKWSRHTCQKSIDCRYVG